jgi:hypothetical protein
MSRYGEAAFTSVALESQKLFFPPRCVGTFGKCHYGVQRWVLEDFLEFRIDEDRAMSLMTDLLVT